jgi:Ca2+-binding RTX toxin-like protein
MSKYEDYDYDHNDRDDELEFEVVINNTTNNKTNNTTINTTVINNTTVIDTIINNNVQTKNYIYGTRRKDYLMGTDANDVIYGYNANDTLIGGLGADKLIGGRGKNVYSSAPDDATDFIYIQRDNKVDKVTSIGLEDRVVIKGPHITVSETSGGIGVFYKDRLQALYTGDELSYSEFKSIVV